MPVNQLFTVTIPAGVALYRITDTAYNTPRATQHKQVVSGMGSRRSATGGRYNHPGALTVYFADRPETCFAERMFYFHREVLEKLDNLHLPLSRGIPSFSMKCTLWEVRLKKTITDVIHLTQGNASAVGVIPSLMLNPSQDYQHLKDRRAYLESQGYKGIRAPSSRATGGGEMIVLFDDQSSNAELTPFDVECRLITASAAPFANHMTDLLDFTAGEVRFAGAAPKGVGYKAWTRVEFNN